MLVVIRLHSGVFDWDAFHGARSSGGHRKATRQACHLPDLMRCLLQQVVKQYVLLRCVAVMQRAKLSYNRHQKSQKT